MAMAAQHCIWPIPDHSVCCVVLPAVYPAGAAEGPGNTEPGKDAQLAAAACPAVRQAPLDGLQVLKTPSEEALSAGLQFNSSPRPG